MIDKCVPFFARLKILSFPYYYPLTCSKFLFICFPKMPSASSAKKLRSAISDDMKWQICMYATKLKNKNRIQQQIASYFNEQNENLDVDRSTISKIIKKKEKWLAILPSQNNIKTFHHKEVKYSQIEEALGLWVENANANNLVISKMIIKEKALFLHNNLIFRMKIYLFQMVEYKNSKGTIIFVNIIYIVK